MIGEALSSLRVIRLVQSICGRLFDGPLCCQKIQLVGELLTAAQPMHWWHRHSCLCLGSHRQECLGHEFTCCINCPAGNRNSKRAAEARHTVSTLAYECSYLEPDAKPQVAGLFYSTQSFSQSGTMCQTSAMPRTRWVRLPGKECCPCEPPPHRSPFRQPASSRSELRPRITPSSLCG